MSTLIATPNASAQRHRDVASEAIFASSSGWILSIFFHVAFPHTEVVSSKRVNRIFTVRLSEEVQRNPV